MKWRKESFLAILLSGVLIGQLLPANQAAAAQGTDGFCQHHREHTQECGYVEAQDETTCQFICEECQKETEESQCLASETTKAEDVPATEEKTQKTPADTQDAESESTESDVASVTIDGETAESDGETTESDGETTESDGEVTDDVASVTINGQTQNYTDLDAAAKAVSGTGGILKLLKNVIGRTQPLELAGPMIFDLGGYTLNGNLSDKTRGCVEITSEKVQIVYGNVKVEGRAATAVIVGKDAELSGNAQYSGTNTLENQGTVSGGEFTGICTTTGTIAGGRFTDKLSLDPGSRLQGGIFDDAVIISGGGGGIFSRLVSGYVGYDNAGNIVFDKNTLEHQIRDFTGEVRAHTPHTYDYTTSEDGNGNYICSESNCPICGVSAPEGAGYTITIPKTVQLGSDTEIFVKNALSQEKTVTVSMNETQVTLTRENDPDHAQIVSEVTFEGLFAAQGEQKEGKVTFKTPVYNNDTNAVIPAGIYKGTLTFTIGLQ